ncbi:hypothetical protein [Deinococcus radiotolerans]|uniref:Magnesium transporter MgtE intracellular domain-containing protein n=1 Tax=Deinococcus radiotolerans TaxID=1309407 RepID=A0ABQ2FH75_9DEIO|nr:hypothetical protein [Deinococcus radiotolerans]GGK98412.1 hypothetical protein GCM10010844_15790 [Deinococcus radiotolerans]
MLGLLILLLALLIAAPLAWRFTRRAAPPTPAPTPEIIPPLPSQDVRPTAPTLVMPGESAALLDDAQAEMLADISPEQLRHLMAAVPGDVMARAIGQEDLTSHAPVTEEQRQELQGLGGALDSLDLWNLGSAPDPKDVPTP